MLVRSIFAPAVTTTSIGFLPASEPLHKLTQTCLFNIEINQLAEQLPALLKSKRLRARIDKLNAQPTLYANRDLMEAPPAEKDLALTFISALAQAYIFEDAEQPIKHLPAIIAKPLYELSKERQRFPIMTYNDYVLNNWTKLDPNGGITLDNIRPLITLTGTDDEAWFIMIHVAIEAAAGPAISAAVTLFNEARNPKPDAVILQKGLQTICTSLQSVIEIMRRMQERCHPDIFWNVLRPYLGGWERTKPADCDNPGVRFEGVDTKDKKPFAFTGQSGAQSSILPALDAVLNVKHEIDGMFQQLLKFKEYMPMEHQALITTFAAFSKLEMVVSKLDYNIELVTAHAAAVNMVKQMRGAHLALVHAFIYKPAGAAGISRDALTGTGGAPIDTYLAGRYNQTSQALR